MTVLTEGEYLRATENFATPAINLAGSTSGSTKFVASATASGVLTFPATTDTIATLAGTQTFTNKIFTAPTINGGTINLPGRSVAASVTAAGTSLATATLLNTDINVIGAAASGTGVALPTPATGLEITIFNTATNNIKVYPNSAGGTIDGGGAGSAVTLTTALRCTYFCTATSTTGGTWLSAQLGVKSA